MTRYNTDTNDIEYYNGAAETWQPPSSTVTIVSCAATYTGSFQTWACKAVCPAGYIATGGGFNNGAIFSENGRYLKSSAGWIYLRHEYRYLQRPPTTPLRHDMFFNMCEVGADLADIGGKTDAMCSARPASPPILRPRARWKTSSHGSAREHAHNQALRSHWRQDHARRGRADHDLAREREPQRGFRARLTTNRPAPALAPVFIVRYLARTQRA